MHFSLSFIPRCRIRRSESLPEKPKSTNPNVQYLNELYFSHLWDMGYTGSGWYFWDETATWCHGPYSSAETAEKQLTEYAKTL